MKQENMMGVVADIQPPRGFAALKDALSDAIHPPDVSAPVSGQRINIDPNRVERDLGRLVLTLVEFLRELLERQAIRRMEAETLSEDEVENVGLALMRLADRVEELKEHFGIGDAELNLDLGPLGKLM